MAILTSQEARLNREYEEDQAFWNSMTPAEQAEYTAESAAHDAKRLGNFETDGGC